MPLRLEIFVTMCKCCNQIILSNLFSCNCLVRLEYVVPVVCLLIFYHILYFEIIQFAGGMRNNDVSPAVGVEKKCESAVREKYPATCENLLSSQRYCIKQSAELQNDLAPKYANYCRYSESVPLLYGERISQCLSTSFS